MASRRLFRHIQEGLDKVVESTKKTNYEVIVGLGVELVCMMVYYPLGEQCLRQ